jgi:PAS domain S-box-containing protein
VRGLDPVHQNHLDEGSDNGSPLLEKSSCVIEVGKTNEVQALAEAVLEAASIAGLGVTVSFDDGAATRFIYVNDAIAQTLGYEVPELIGEPFAILGAEGVQQVRGLLTRWRQGAGAPGLVETIVLRKDGAAIPVEIALSVVELARQPAMVMFVRDIREKKQFQAQLAVSDRMATLGMLAANVAHEINNPLAYVSLNVEAMARRLLQYAPESLSERIRTEVESTREGLGRVAAIVRDLQTLAVPKSVERWPVDVRAVAASTLTVAMHAIRGRARVTAEYEEVAPLTTDPTRLSQVLLNLVLNAAQSFCESDDSKNVITVRVTQPREEEVLVAISDNGPGIAEEHINRIFDPFFTTKESGMGLGLAICQSLAHLLRAKLAVTSELGKGTTFTLHLPALARAQ